MEASRKLLSVVMPAMNEEKNLSRAYEEVTRVLSALPYEYEVIVIDNDSSDGTAAVAAELCARDTRWRFVKFSRNFTVEISITAGLRFAAGDAALVLFSDLQDPPELIPDFVKRWEEGFDVVYGLVRGRSGDPLWKSLAAKLHYKLINALSEIALPPNATDFRLFGRRAIDAMNGLDERNRYTRGLAHWIGFKSTGIVYDRRPREAGHSKAPFFYLINIAINAVTCFTIKPLQMFSMAGAFSAAATLFLTATYVAGCFGAPSIPGLAAVHLLLLANLSVMLLGFGAIGEYVGRTYIETKRRPLFVVERTINMDRAPRRGDGT